MTIVVSEIMSSPAITVRPNAGIHEISKIIADSYIRAVPVADDEGGLAGLVPIVGNGQVDGIVSHPDLINTIARPPAMAA